MSGDLRAGLGSPLVRDAAWRSALLGAAVGIGWMLGCGVGALIEWLV